MAQVWRKYTREPSKLDSFYMTGGMLVLFFCFFVFFLAAFPWILGIRTLILETAHQELHGVISPAPDSLFLRGGVARQGKWINEAQGRTNVFLQKTTGFQQTLSIFSSLLPLSSKAMTLPEFSEFLCSFSIHRPLLIPESAQQRLFVRSQLQLGSKISRLDPSSARRKSSQRGRSHFICWRLLDSVSPKNILPIRQTLSFHVFVCVCAVLSICVCVFVCMSVLVYAGARV